ncbi:cupin domain-containing protein [Phenylobacterium koreense]|uniref:Quercetin dioxygenase-like cupin family protein n=1 Tax=Phenylobacterium koreense TaxID=266125 RepID=A0ABV2EME3_9CAUL
MTRWPTLFLLSALWGGAALAQSLGPGLETQGAQHAMLVEPVAEKVVDRLPAGALYWRIEAYPSLPAAQTAAGAYALAAQAWGRSWLFTLGPPGGSSGGTRIAEIGPVSIPTASAYRLRINRAGGPPGVQTPVHTHPGSEAFYVLKGQLTQRGSHGEIRLDAGQALKGHEPGMVMQLTSSGSGDLEQLVMFVVDADKPFSMPASFD